MLSAFGNRFTGKIRKHPGQRIAWLVAVTCLAMLTVGCGTARYDVNATATGTAVPSPSSPAPSSSSDMSSPSPTQSSPGSTTPAPSATVVSDSPEPSAESCVASQLAASQSSALEEGMGQTWLRYQITNTSGQSCTTEVGLPTLAYADAAGDVTDSFSEQGPALSTGQGTLTIAPGDSVYFIADIHSGCWLTPVSGGPFQFTITLPGNGPTVIDSAAGINFPTYKMCTSQYVTEGVLQPTPPPGPLASESTAS